MKHVFTHNEHTKVYFVSDTHFSHLNILKYCKRPYRSIDEMDENLISNWNSLISNKDTVFHLGDIAFCNADRLKEILNRLNGKIYLVLGNHDDFDTIEKVKDRFEAISPQMNIVVNSQKIIMNHDPMLTYHGVYKKHPTWQLFGHVHTTKFPNEGLDQARLQFLMSPQYDVGVDFNDYTPIDFEQLKEKMDYQIKNNVNMLTWLNYEDSSNQ